MAKYTVWVQQADGRGTTHVSAHEADTPEQAETLALDETADDWDWGDKPLRVLGIAEGDVKIVTWDDLDG